MGRGRRAKFFATVFAIGALSRAAAALADPKLQGLAETSAGYTDNIQSAPDAPLPGVAPKVAGAFLTLRPGVVLASASANIIHRLAYTYQYDLFLQQSTASTSSNQLEYRGFFDLAPRASLVVGAGAVQSNQYSALTLTPPGAGAVNAVAAGSGAFLAANANEVLSLDLGPNLRGYQGSGVAEQAPLFNTVAPSTFLLTGRLGLDRPFRTDAVGAEARAEYSLVEGSLDPSGKPLGVQEQIIGTGVGLWRHDWTRALTSQAEAGVLRVQRLEANRGFWEPTGSASLSYITPFGDADLAYAHRVTTNLLIGQTLLVDEVRLRGALPLTHQGDVLVAASSGFQSGWVLDQNVALAARVDAILADVGVTWQATDLLRLGLRYQYFQQISDAQVPPLPISFVKNTVMLGAALRFPPERDMPRAYRAPRRVDGTDEIRGAAEPDKGGSHPGSRAGGT